MIADDMAIFAKVVEMNGFTAAARVLSVPKVRISRSVAHSCQPTRLRTGW